jgi:hypothetical protein
MYFPEPELSVRTGVDAISKRLVEGLAARRAAGLAPFEDTTMRHPMHRASLALVISCGICAPAAAEDRKLEFKAAKGHAAEYTVRETTSSEGGRGGNTWSSESETEITYGIEVAEKKENGDAVIKVTYKSVKAKQAGGDRTWEFDSAKKDEGDEAAAGLRQAISKPITVEVSGGKVTEISGIEEPQRQEGGEPREAFGRMRAARIAGRRAIQRHIEMILAAPAQNQKLEKGKEYKQEARQAGSAQDSSGEGENRRRGFGRDNYLVAYKFEGEEKARGAQAAKFKLGAFRRPAGGDAPEPRGELKGDGVALVSLDDGMLLELQLSAESVTEFERDGETSKRTMKSKISIERKGGAPKEVRTASL